MGLDSIILFAVVVMFAYLIEGFIGFGGTIMALPIASSIAGLKLAVPVMTIVVLLASIVIALRDIKYIDKKQFVKITILMILGLPIGMWLFKSLPERPLKIALGIFMIIVSVKGLYYNTDKRKEELPKKANKLQIGYKTMKLLENIVIFLGGIVHGAFTCGGPFVVVYATKNIKNKTSFRATLCALWATLNGIMLMLNTFKGEISFEIIKVSAITMPFVVVAIVVSNILHKKVNGEAFTKFVYAALFVAGILMMM